MTLFSSSSSFIWDLAVVSELVKQDIYVHLQEIVPFPEVLNRPLVHTSTNPSLCYPVAISTLQAFSRQVHNGASIVEAHLRLTCLSMQVGERGRFPRGSLLWSGCIPKERHLWPECLQLGGGWDSSGDQDVEDVLSFAIMPSKTQWKVPWHCYC